MTAALGYNPFGDTRSTYSVPSARTRRRGSWVRAGIILMAVVLVAVGVGTWASLRSAEQKMIRSTDQTYALALTLSGIDEYDEIDRLARLVAQASLSEVDPDDPQADPVPVPEEEITAAAAEFRRSVTTPPVQFDPYSPTAVKGRALLPVTTLCYAALHAPPEDRDGSTLYNTCQSYQGSVLRMAEDIATYNGRVEYFGLLSWGHEKVPPLVGSEGESNPMGAEPDMLDRLQNEGG